MQLARYFNENFYVCQAESEELLNSCYRVRHEVYCKEYGYEAVQSNGLEKDPYDPCALHSVIMQKEQDSPIGCLRLIETGPDSMNKKLPVQAFCPDSLDPNLFDLDRYPPGHIAEFSRLAVKKDFRMRAEDRRNTSVPDRRKLAQIEDAERQSDRRRRIERRRFPVATLSLFMSGMVLLARSDAEAAIAMMEPKLGRMLRMSGFLFQPIGKLVDYHGPRAPFIVFRHQMFDCLTTPAVTELYNSVKASMDDPAAARESFDFPFIDATSRQSSALSRA